MEVERAGGEQKEGWAEERTGDAPDSDSREGDKMTGGICCSCGELPSHVAFLKIGLSALF